MMTYSRSSKSDTFFLPVSKSREARARVAMKEGLPSEATAREAEKSKSNKYPDLSVSSLSLHLSLANPNQEARSKGDQGFSY